MGIRGDGKGDFHPVGLLYSISGLYMYFEQSLVGAEETFELLFLIICAHVLGRYEKWVKKKVKNRTPYRYNCEEKCIVIYA